MIEHPRAATGPTQRVPAAGRPDQGCPPIDTWVDDLDAELSIEPDPHQPLTETTQSQFAASLIAPAQ
jgi:hypothetical protein